MQNDRDRRLYSNNGKNPFVSADVDLMRSTPTSPATLDSDNNEETSVHDSMETDDKSSLESQRAENVPLINKPSPTVADFPIEWTATDNINRNPNKSWYISWIIIIALLATGAFLIQFLTGEWQFWTSAGLAILIFVSIIIVHRRPSETIHYSLDNIGLHIGDKIYGFNEFRAFGLTNNDGTWTLSLIPVKRLGTAITAIVPPDQGEVIIDHIGERLPMESVDNNFVSTLYRRFKL